MYKRQVLHGAVALGVPGFLIPGVLRLHMVRIILVVVHPLDFLKAEIRLLRVLDVYKRQSYHRSDFTFGKSGIRASFSSRTNGEGSTSAT